MKKISFAKSEDFFEIVKIYKNTESYEQKLIQEKRVIVFKKDNKIIGFLNFSYFWEHIPFLDLIYFIEEERNKGYGKDLILFFEDEMKKKGFSFVLTSTQSNERAQNFYRRNNYVDCGCLLLPKEPTEIFLLKSLKV